MVVGYAAGGATDISARVLAQKLSEMMGQQVVVDNRPGASSMLAAEIVARSAPDGYTVLVANAPIAMPSLFPNLPIDLRKDLAPVSLVGYGPLVLSVHPALPARSVKELVVLAKRRPGELNYATAGSGSFAHLAMELFALMTATKMVHIPYKGGGPSAIATMTGETQVTFASVGSSIEQIKHSKLAALGVTGSKRSVALPNVPTISEAGVPGYEANSWYGMFATANTPREIVARLGERTSNALSAADLKARLLAQGIEPAIGGVDEFTKYFNAEVAKWAKVIKAAAIPLQ